MNRQRGCTVVVSLHQVEYALRYCPRTVALHRGRIVYDGPSAALTPQLLGELYGADAQRAVRQVAGQPRGGAGAVSPLRGRLRCRVTT